MRPSRQTTPSARPPRAFAPPPSVAAPARSEPSPSLALSVSSAPPPSLASLSAPPLEDAQRRLTQLALIIGWERAKRVTDAYPAVKNLNYLADLAYTEDPAATPRPSEAPPTSGATPLSEATPPSARGGAEDRAKKSGGQRKRISPASTPLFSRPASLSPLSPSLSASLSLPSPSLSAPSAVSSLLVFSRPPSASLPTPSPLNNISSSRAGFPLHAMPAIPDGDAESTQEAFEGSLIDWEAESVQAGNGDEEYAPSSTPFQLTLLD